jgi:hypothetical protein
VRHSVSESKLPHSRHEIDSLSFPPEPLPDRIALAKLLQSCKLLGQKQLAAMYSSAKVVVQQTGGLDPGQVRRRARKVVAAAQP